MVLSGPAGSGKTTLAERACQAFASLERVVTATTRDPRAGEVDGRDYHFLSVDDFEARINTGAFYEWAKVHGRYYGTLKAEVDVKLAQGLDLLLVIDVQGAASLREASAGTGTLRGNVVTVFLEPASIDQLRERLRERGSDDELEIAARVETAYYELQRANEFDERITTGTKDEDFAAFAALYERLKAGRQA